MPEQKNDKKNSKRTSKPNGNSSRNLSGNLSGNPNGELNLALDAALDKVILGECASTMAQMPAQSIDTIFADPPYFLQLDKELKRPNESTVEGVKQAWDKFDSLQDYDSFSEKWLLQAKRLLKANGTIWVMGSYHNIYRLGGLLQDLGFWILNDIVWVKNNPMPNFLGRRFTNAHEVLLWCAKDKNSKHRFNYRALKKLNDEKQMRSDWRLPICSGKERLRKGDGKSLHPTQKPIALLYRVILSSTAAGDVVLDPFCGSGTSLATCKMLGRKYIGIEREVEYANAAQARLAETSSPADAEALFLPEPREQARDVTFATLLENGWLAPGEKLESKCRKFQASITSDGDLTHRQRRASIHRLAAELAGRQSCNGWEYWHYQQKDDSSGLPAMNSEGEGGVARGSANGKQSGEPRGKPRGEPSGEPSGKQSGKQEKLATASKKTRRVPLDELRQALRATLKQAANSRQQESSQQGNSKLGSRLS